MVPIAGGGAASIPLPAILSLQSESEALSTACTTERAFTDQQQQSQKSAEHRKNPSRSTRVALSRGQPMSEHCNKRPLDVPVPTSEPPWLRSFRIPGATGGDPQIFPPACAIPQSSRMRTNIQGEFCLRSPRIAGCVRRHRHFHRLHQGSTALPVRGSAQRSHRSQTNFQITAPDPAIDGPLAEIPPPLTGAPDTQWDSCTGCSIACRPLHDLCRLKPALSPGRLACGKSLVSRPRPARFQPCTFSTKQCWTLPSSS